MPALVTALREAYEKPAERLARGAKAMQWVKERRTWARAGDALASVLDGVWVRRSGDFARKYAQPAPPTPQPATSPAGNVTVYNVNAPIQVFANEPDDMARQVAEKVNGTVLVPLVESDEQC
jgi:hypothetical protein